MIIAMIFLVFAAFFGLIAISCIKRIKNKKVADSDKLNNKICLAISIIGVVFGIIVSHTFYDAEIKEEKAILCEAEGWEVYINGQAVELKNVDIESYFIKFDEENQLVILIPR